MNSTIKLECTSRVERSNSCAIIAIEGDINSWCTAFSLGLRCAPIPGAIITVCTSAGTGTPCSPIAPIYTDQALTQQITGSVVTADSNGNFGWWAPAGNYTYSITAARVTGKLFSLTLPANPSSLAGGGYQFADQFPHRQAQPGGRQQRRRVSPRAHGFNTTLTQPSRLKSNIS